MCRLQGIKIAAVLSAVILLIALLPGTLRYLGSAQSSMPVSTKGEGYPLTVHDCRGVDVTVKKMPRRIVSLSPAITEILFCIGAGDRVAAVTSYCDYPPEVKKLPKVGGYLDPNVEKVSELAPDLVLLARGTKRDIIDRLSSLGFTVVAVDPTSLDGVLSTIRLIGRVAGEDARAESLAASLSARRDAVAQKTVALPEESRPETLFLFSLSDLFSAGPENHIDNIIRLAGGRNMAREMRVPWPQLSMETVVTRNPEVIFVMAGHGGEAKCSQEHALKTLQKDRRWRTVSAVKNGRVYLLDDDSITLPGPRLFDGLEQAARALHPQLFGTGGAK